MNDKTKKKLTAIAAVILLAVCAVWMLTDGTEHIADSNGAENHALAVITDKDILDLSVSPLGLEKSADKLSDTVRFSSGKFTGIYEVMWTDVLFSTGLQLNILDYEVNAGNFRMVLINDGRIVAELEPGDDYPVDLGELSGEVKLVIAGESADFSFRLFASDYDSYSHHQ